MLKVEKLTNTHLALILISPSPNCNFLVLLLVRDYHVMFHVMWLCGESQSHTNFLELIPHVLGMVEKTIRSNF